MNCSEVMNLRVPRTYEAVQMTLSPIHAYPAFKVEIASAVSPECPMPLRAAWISAHAATMELSTMKPNDSKSNGVTLPPNQRTSPYAITIMVKFLKIVYTGILRYCCRT